MPEVVGSLLAGLAVGPHGLCLIDEHHPVAKFLTELGTLLLMFFAGLRAFWLFALVEKRSAQAEPTSAQRLVEGWENRAAVDVARLR